MSIPPKQRTGDDLLRVSLIAARIRRQQAIINTTNPLDVFISEQRIAHHETKSEVSKVSELTRIFEDKMSRKCRWDCWCWSPPVYREFGVIGDGKERSSGENSGDRRSKMGR